MVRFCKEEMNMESVTVVTNGSKVIFMGKLHRLYKLFIDNIISIKFSDWYVIFVIVQVTENWMKEYGYWLDIMAVSCDSFDEEINKKIGRYQ